MWGLFSSKKACIACEEGLDEALLAQAVEIVKIAKEASADGHLTRKERSAIMKGMWSLLKKAELSNSINT